MRLVRFCSLALWALGSFGTTAFASTAQERAVALITKLGGSVEVDPRAPGKPVVEVDLHETKVTHADLEQIRALTSLRHLDLRLTKIGDTGVGHLRICVSSAFSIFSARRSATAASSTCSASELQSGGL